MSDDVEVLRREVADLKWVVERLIRWGDMDHAAKSQLADRLGVKLSRVPDGEG